MPSTTVATGSFPSRKAANQAVQRLVSSGFARNSIELRRHDEDEGYDLEIHTRKENLRRAERLINASMPGYVVGQAMSGAVQTARSHPIILLGAGVLAGFAIYTLLSRGEGDAASGSSRGSGARARRR
jgi:hypothetical protein